MNSFNLIPPFYYITTISYYSSYFQTKGTVFYAKFQNTRKGHTLRKH